MIVGLNGLDRGLVTLFARGVSYEHMEALVALGQEHGFSIMVHADWHGDYESDMAGQVMAFDVTDGRRIDTPAGANDIEPVVYLKDALSNTREELIALHSLPKDLTD